MPKVKYKPKPGTGTQALATFLADLKINDTPAIKRWLKVPGNLTKLSQAIDKKLKAKGLA